MKLIPIMALIATTAFGQIGATWDGALWPGTTTTTTMTDHTLAGGKMILTWRSETPSQWMYPEGGGPGPTIKVWRDIYGVSNNAVVMLRTENATVVPAQTTTTPERVEWPEVVTNLVHKTNSPSDNVWIANTSNLACMTDFTSTNYPIGYRTNSETAREMEKNTVAQLERISEPPTVHWQYDPIREENKLAVKEDVEWEAFRKEFVLTNTSPMLIINRFTEHDYHPLTFNPSDRELGYRDDGAVVWRTPPELKGKK